MGSSSSKQAPEKRDVNDLDRDFVGDDDYPDDMQEWSPDDAPPPGPPRKKKKASLMPQAGKRAGPASAAVPRALYDGMPPEDARSDYQSSLFQDSKYNAPDSQGQSKGFFLNEDRPLSPEEKVKEKPIDVAMYERNVFPDERDEELLALQADKEAYFQRPDHFSVKAKEAYVRLYDEYGRNNTTREIFEQALEDDRIDDEALLQLAHDLEETASKAAWRGRCFLRKYPQYHPRFVPKKRSEKAPYQKDRIFLENARTDYVRAITEQQIIMLRLIPEDQRERIEVEIWERDAPEQLARAEQKIKTLELENAHKDQQLNEARKWMTIKALRGDPDFAPTIPKRAPAQLPVPRPRALLTEEQLEQAREYMERRATPVFAEEEEEEEPPTPDPWAAQTPNPWATPAVKARAKYPTSILKNRQPIRQSLPAPAQNKVVRNQPVRATSMPTNQADPAARDEDYNRGYEEAIQNINEKRPLKTMQAPFPAVSKRAPSQVAPQGKPNQAMHQQQQNYNSTRPAFKFPTKQQQAPQQGMKRQASMPAQTSKKTPAMTATPGKTPRMAQTPGTVGGRTPMTGGGRTPAAQQPPPAQAPAAVVKKKKSWFGLRSKDEEAVAPGAGAGQQNPAMRQGQGQGQTPAMRQAMTPGKTPMMPQGGGQGYAKAGGKGMAMNGRMGNRMGVAGGNPQPAWTAAPAA